MPSQMKDFDVIGSYSANRVIPFDPERTVNMFEYRDPFGKKKKANIYTSGLKIAKDLTGTTTGGARASTVFQAVNQNPSNAPWYYQVFGKDVYVFDNALNQVQKFSFTSSSAIGYVGVDANTYQVIFVDGQEGWIFDTVTRQAVQITDPAFPTKPIDVCYLDGFFVVANGDTNQFQLSKLDQGLVWGVMDATTINANAPYPTIALTPSGNMANMQIGTTVVFSTTGTLPVTLPALVAGQTYYIVGHPTPSTISISATDGGTPLSFTAAGTGLTSITNNGQLQLATISSHPGNIVACRTLHRKLFLFSQYFTEVWENQGRATNLPFRRINSLLLEYGTPAVGSIAGGYGALFFLSQDGSGLGPVMEIQGTTAQPISTHDLDFTLSNFAEVEGVSDARAFLIKENGIIFYRLNFTAANHTFVYNATMSNPANEAEKLWHEEEVLNGDRHIAETHGYINGDNLVASYKEAKLYYLDNSFLTNDDEPIHRTRITRSFVPEGYNRIRIDRFQLDLLQGDPASTDIIIQDVNLLTELGDPILTETGLNLILEQGISTQSTEDAQEPLVYLSISKDGGQTFGYVTAAPMGKIGQRSFRTIWRKLGTIPRGQGFVAKIEFFDEYPFTIMGAGWAIEVMPE